MLTKLAHNTVMEFQELSLGTILSLNHLRITATVNQYITIKVYFDRKHLDNCVCCNTQSSIAAKMDNATTAGPNHPLQAQPSPSFKIRRRKQLNSLLFSQGC
jgi:hypothetical protein